MIRERIQERRRGKCKGRPRSMWDIFNRKEKHGKKPKVQCEIRKIELVINFLKFITKLNFPNSNIFEVTDQFVSKF